jgi:hypothetical protein
LRSVEELIERSRRAKPARRTLEEFCGYLGETFAPSHRRLLPSVEEIAQEFRQFFQLPVPVAPALKTLLESLNIALIPHGNSRDPDACASYDTETQRWEILIRFDVGKRESLCILRELWLILFAYSGHRVPWWEAWSAEMGIVRPRTVADRFACAVVLPPPIFPERALECGLNPWTLANRFLTTPGACCYALLRQMRLPFPYFQALLNFCPDPPQQTRLFFQENSVKAEVWKKGIRRVYGRAAGNWPEMEALGVAFPRAGSIVEVDGGLYRAIKACFPTVERTASLVGVQLPKPVCVVARPNGTAQSQMFVQAVPCGHEEVLLDEVLREQATRSSP